MRTIFLKEFERTRRSLLLWCIVMSSLIVFGILEYPFVSKYIQNLIPVFNAMPKIVSIMFGIYQVDFSSTIGYYLCMYFWSTCVTYVHATYIGASLISKDEQNKTSDYLYTKPFKRRTIVQAKIYAGLGNVMIMAIVLSALSCISLMMIGMDMLDMQRVLLTLVGMFFTQVMLMMMGFACSMLTQTYKKGLVLSMTVLFGFYGLSMMIQYFENIEYLNFLTPLQYFDAKQVIFQGFQFHYLCFMVIILVICSVILFKKIEKREFHS